MRTLGFIPYGIDDIYDYYGDPSSENFWDDMTESMPLPFPMRAHWNIETIFTTLRVHKLVADSLHDALLEIEKYYGYEFLHASGLDITGGVHSHRSKATDSTQLSTHAWLIAMDYAPNYGKIDMPSSMPHAVVRAFTRRGWIWGGDWPIKDGMHFQACRGY